MRPLPRFFFLLLLVLTEGIFLTRQWGPVSAETIVRASEDDECTRTVFIQIEIFTNRDDLTDGAMETLADVWARQIDARWNGPTDEAIQQAAKQIGMSDEEVQNYGSWDVNDSPILKKHKDNLENTAKENMANATGAESCAVVNCCKIYFHTIIQTRKPGDTPREGFYQIEVMDSDFRSFVRRGGSTVEENQKGASGKWALENESSSAAHEAGHLMGIGDFYHDEEGEDGKEHSIGDKGHESDLMNESNGWPKGEHITKILEIAGKPCNCCRFSETDNQFNSGLAMDFAFAGEALAGNNCELLATAKTNLENKLRNLQALRIPALKKVETANNIKKELDKVNKALENCDKQRPVTGDDDPAISTGENVTTVDEVPTVPFSFDSLVCVNYGGGTVDLPIFPTYPFGMGNPTFPMGPVQGPAAGPKDTRPPEITPGPTDTRPPEPTAPPPEDRVTVPKGEGLGSQGKDIVVPDPTKVQLPPELQDTIIERASGPGADETPAKDDIQTEMLDMNLTSGGIVVPFGKIEYEENQDQINIENEGKIVTPFDLPNLFFGTREEEKPELIITVSPRIVSEGDEGGSTTTGAPPQEEEKQQIIIPPTWVVFKVEQDVQDSQGNITKNPAEKTVMKLGFPPPEAKPGSGVQRTAEDTNNGASSEPRFAETDENGLGAVPIFTDGFESGDTSSWGFSETKTERTVTQYGDSGLTKTFTETTTQGDNVTETQGAETPYDEFGRPQPSTNKNTNAGSYHIGEVRLMGYTVDATPMKSRIVYLDTRFLAIDDKFRVGIGIDWNFTLDDPDPAKPDDLNNNGSPDWTEPGNETTLGPGTEPGSQGSGGDLGEGGGASPKTGLPVEVKPYVMDAVQFGNTLGITLGYKYYEEDQVLQNLDGYFTQENSYRIEKAGDPYFESKGTWGQPYDDQWAIKSVGFTGEDGDAWQEAGDELQPVIVAFIDTGLDWNHADISWDNIWVNEDEIPDNGIDDDRNGYVDDAIGWDFYANSPTPWDQDGHGTFTAGMVIAAKSNGIGIAGINPAAKVMILKALNDFGHTRASYIAKAIKYATDNGAKVINLSIGGDHLTYLEQLAVKYAFDRGVLIVVAAGNEAKEVSDYGLTPYEEVIAVASTDFNEKRAFFSNHGPEIDIAAPGLDVLSLRARMTDFMRHLENVPYEPGSAYVGDDKRYFRSSGTSFSAPIVTGVASLIWSKYPNLTNIEVRRMILNSATDVEIPGHDSFTGYGIINAKAALEADPAFEIVADITKVEAVQDEAGAYFVSLSGTAGANDFDVAEIQIGTGENPRAWKTVGQVSAPVTNGALGLIPADEFRTAPVWTIRLVVRHKNGRTREEWYVLQLG